MDKAALFLRAIDMQVAMARRGKFDNLGGWAEAIGDDVLATFTALERAWVESQKPADERR